MSNYVLDHTGQQINTKLTKAENIDNKVTSLSSNSTDVQYPSAKVVYDHLTSNRNAINNKQDIKPDGQNYLINSSTGKVNMTYIPTQLTNPFIFGGIITDKGNTPDGIELDVTLSDAAKAALNTTSSARWLYDDESLYNASDFTNMFFINTLQDTIIFCGLTVHYNDWLVSLNNTWYKIDNTTVSTLAWTDITNKPTTLSGYGITDIEIQNKTANIINDLLLAGSSDYRFVGVANNTITNHTSTNPNIDGYDWPEGRNSGDIILYNNNFYMAYQDDSYGWGWHLITNPLILTQHQDISGKENTSNKDTSINNTTQATDSTHYPTVGAVRTYVNTQTDLQDQYNLDTFVKKTTLIAWDASLGSPGDGGWRRLGYFSTLSKNSETSYSLGEMYITGMYLDHFTTVATVEFVTQSSNVDLKQISGVLNPAQNGNTISRVRLVNKASGQWYLDVYIPSLATDKRIGTQYIILKGYYNFTSDTSNNTNNFLSSTIENAITNKKVCNLRDMSGDLHETHISLLRTAATSTQLSGSTHWKRVCILKNISGEASPVGQIYLTGTYNSSQPTIAIFDFACYYNTASISQVYGLKNLNNAQAIDKIRLVYKSSTEWYLDIHSKTNLVGNVSIGIIGYFEATNIVDPNDNTFLTSEPASGTFIAECTIQNENGSIADRLSTPLTPADLDLGNAKIYYGTCSTAAATTQKDVVCATYPRTGDPVKGDIIFVTFDNTNSAAVADLTLKIGNSTAKHIVYQNTTSIGDLPAAEYLIANNTYRFQYDGTNWIVILNYNTNTNTQTRIYKENTNGERPLIASRTAASSITSGSTAVYGIIPGTAANIPTMNPSTGKLTVPGGIQIGTSSVSPSTYTTTIYGTTDIDRLEIQEDVIPTNEGCKLGDEGWEWDTIYSNNYIGSAELTGTPTAPTAAAGTNTTQIATTAFVQSAISDKQKQHIATSVTLPAANWSNHNITVTVNGVTSTNTVIVNVAPTSIDAAIDSQVYCNGQSSNTLAFHCNGKNPTTDIVVNVLILPD